MNAGFSYRAIVGPEEAGRSVVDHLALRYGHSSPGTWRGRVEAGRVLLDGRAVTADTILRAGQCLVWNRPPWTEPAVPLAWALLHQDGHLLAAAKPAGLPTLPGGGYLDHTLLALVRRRHPGASPVHRLDRGASGIVLFALSAQARVALARAFRERCLVKRYLAIIEGSPHKEAFVIETPIGRVEEARLGSVYAAVPPSAAGRPARTEVEVLERRGETTLVAVRPITGRPHQIRIHLAAAGWPLRGEPVYAPGGGLRADAGRPGEVGYHLHAEWLEFEHPDGSGMLRLTCSPPRVLRAGGHLVRVDINHPA